MPGGKYGRQMEDDWEDGYSDDEWTDEEYDAEEQQPQTAPKAAAVGARMQNSGGAAGGMPTGSTGDELLSQLIPGFVPAQPAAQRGGALSGSGGGAAAGKPQLAARVAQQASQAAPVADAAAELRRFQFDRPSPDDAVAAAQQQRGGGGTSSSSRSTNALARPAGASQSGPQAAAAQDPQPGAAAAAGVQLDENGWQKLPLHVEMEMMQQAAEGADGTAALQADDKPRERAWKEARPEQEQAPAEQAPELPTAAQGRPLSEYVMEAELARACEAAAARERDAEGRSSLHLVVLGHVDAGKSTLMGRLLHDLGVVSEKVAHKRAREAAREGKASFAWAWLLDERPQERARGVTIDVASARFATPRHAVTLLDAPGHRDCVPNMIAGAAQADAALLVVDGSRGGFETGFDSGGGQTREHAQLARSLGIGQLAVVVSKLDTCEYSQHRFEEIRGQLAPFLRQCGFRERALQWLPAVGPAGENLTRPPAAPELAAWWTGPTLVQAIDAFEPAERRTSLPLRMPIGDISRGDRGGHCVSGKLEAGAMKVGMRVRVLPSAEEASIKSIDCGGQAVQLARAGDSVDVALTGVDATSLTSGAVLCHPDFPVPLVSEFEAQVLVLDVPMPLLRGQQVTIHAHAARETGHLSQLVSVADARDAGGSNGAAKPRRPRVLLGGQTGVVRVAVSRPVCLQLYADCRPLGRVVLRDGGRTVAVGVVTAILA